MITIICCYLNIGISGKFKFIRFQLMYEECERCISFDFRKVKKDKFIVL